MKVICAMMLFLHLMNMCCYADKTIHSLSAISSSSTQMPSNQLLSVSQALPCVAVHQVHFTGLSQLPLIKPESLKEWKLQLEGQCIKEDALLLYADHLNEQIAQMGYVTSYIYYPEQSLLFGVLNIDFIAGKLSSIEYQNGSHDSWSLMSAFPLQRGQVINIHQVNQGLANLRNSQLIPYQIDIISGNEGSNVSRLVIQRNAARAFKGRLLLESTQSQDRPTNMVSNIIMLANPLLLNDFFYMSLDSDTGEDPSKKLKSASVLYSLPYHYWLFSLYAGYQESTNHKNLQLIDDVKVRNDLRSRLLSLQAEYIFYRAPHSTTSASFGTQIQTLDLFLEQYRLETQKRFASYGLLGLNHKRDFAQGSATFSLKYKQGIDWFGATRQQISGLDSARIYQFSVDIQRAFLLARQSMYHRHELEVQLSHSKLDPMLEVDSITGRFGVRGFTNSTQIENSGNNTLKLKNELVWFLPWQGAQLYSGLDFATTSNDRSRFWRENMLIGTEFGIRGQVDRVGYQLFFDAPLWQSIELQTDPINVGAKLSINY
ncbi:ShlB/FhaC/HecB family hemolysin secretion/activation protein [Providencia burhodogranariea]|uniref:Putative hemolysin activator protein n=1 Tax=Providencia burhodogranariea DSM 19968 TaxID=1141662 RepID=K8W8W9_9GAMM|nr:putative hemolysin activator protein [Providencia burhodogranariea DSM 19968]